MVITSHCHTKRTVTAKTLGYCHQRWHKQTVDTTQATVLGASSRRESLPGIAGLRTLTPSGARGSAHLHFPTHKKSLQSRQPQTGSSQANCSPTGELGQVGTGSSTHLYYTSNGADKTTHLHTTTRKLGQYVPLQAKNKSTARVRDETLMAELVNGNIK